MFRRPDFVPLRRPAILSAAAGLLLTLGALASVRAQTNHLLPKSAVRTPTPVPAQDTPPPLGAATPAPAVAATPAPSAAPVVATTPAPSASPARPAASGYVGAKVLTREAAGYPIIANLNRIEGIVRAQFAVDEQGKVTDVTVERSSGSVFLDEMVREQSLRRWTFQPATLDGKPVPSNYSLEFEFRLDPAQQRAVGQKRLALPVGTPDAPYPAAALPRRLQGKTTVTLHWTPGGLVDNIYLLKSSGSGLLDATALQWAYEHWRVDPSQVTKDAVTRTLSFAPPP